MAILSNYFVLVLVVDVVDVIAADVIAIVVVFVAVAAAESDQSSRHDDVRNNEYPQVIINSLNVCSLYSLIFFSL